MISGVQISLYVVKLIEGPLKSEQFSGSVPLSPFSAALKSELNQYNNNNSKRKRKCVKSILETRVDPGYVNVQVELVRVKSYCEWVGGSCGSTPCVTVTTATTATAAASTAGESAARRERKTGINVGDKDLRQQ